MILLSLLLACTDENPAQSQTKETGPAFDPMEVIVLEAEVNNEILNPDYKNTKFKDFAKKVSSGPDGQWTRAELQVAAQKYPAELAALCNAMHNNGRSNNWVGSALAMELEGFIPTDPKNPGRRVLIPAPL